MRSDYNYIHTPCIKYYPSKCNKYLEDKYYLPFILNWDGLFSDYVEDPQLPKSIESLTRPILLAPRYYIRIYLPKEICNSGILPTEPISIGIDRSGLLKNTAQLYLLPTLEGSEFDIDKCYKVEYWSYRKNIIPPYIDYLTSIGKCKEDYSNTYKKIHTEYWSIGNYSGFCWHHLIPCSPLSYHYQPLRYNSLSIYRDNDLRKISIDPPYKYRNTNSIILKRIDNDLDKDKRFDSILNQLGFEEALKSFYINKIINLKTLEELKDYSYYMESGDSYIEGLTNERIVRDIGIRWMVGPTPSYSYRIEYIEPYTRNDIKCIK